MVFLKYHGEMGDNNALMFIFVWVVCSYVAAAEAANAGSVVGGEHPLSKIKWRCQSAPPFLYVSFLGVLFDELLKMDASALCKIKEFLRSSGGWCRLPDRISPKTAIFLTKR